MQPLLGQSIVVDNRPGGLFQVGMQALGSAPPDGYTLIHLNTTMGAIQASYKRFDLLKQLTPVGVIGTTIAVLCLANNAPFKTLPEMAAWAKANPGRLTYGSLGPGSMEHLAMVTLLGRAGASGTNVPFKGGPDGALALAQGEIHAMPLPMPLVLQFKDKFRPAATLVEQRNPLLPDVPTAREQGLDIPPVQYWGGLAAPAGTPRASVEALEKALASAVNNPALRQRYMPLGLDPLSGDSQALTRMIEADLRWFGDAVRAANLNLS